MTKKVFSIEIYQQLTLLKVQRNTTTIWDIWTTHTFFGMPEVYLDDDITAAPYISITNAHITSHSVKALS